MDDTKNRRNVVIGITLAGLLVTAGLVGCEQEPSGDAKKEAPAVETKSEPATGEAMQDMSATGEAMQDMSAADEATQDMPAADEATQDMPAADEATQDMPAADEAK